MTIADPAPLILDPSAFVGAIVVVFVLGILAGMIATPFMPKRGQREERETAMRRLREDNGALFDEPDSVRHIGAKRRGVR